MRKIAIACAMLLMGMFFRLRKPPVEGTTLSVWSHEADRAR